MNESSPHSSLSKTAFNPLVALGVRIAKTLSQLRGRAGKASRAA